jgi:hypothetical protein
MRDEATGRIEFSTHDQSVRSHVSAAAKFRQNTLARVVAWNLHSNTINFKCKRVQSQRALIALDLPIGINVHYTRIHSCCLRRVRSDEFDYVCACMHASVVPNTESEIHRESAGEVTARNYYQASPWFICEIESTVD